MTDLSPYQPAMAAEVLAIWQAAAGENLPIMPELWEANTTGDPSFLPADLMVASDGGALIGFVLTKRWRGQHSGLTRYEPIGYVALGAVHPRWQRRGIGRRLLQAAETKMRAEGVTRVVVGGSFHHVLAGLPQWADAAQALLLTEGYALGQTVWDVRRRLSALPELPEVPRLDGFALRPCRDGEAEVLIGFLDDSFPGRWSRDVAHFLETGGPIGHVMGLFAGERPCGFAHLHPPDTVGTGRWAGLVPGISALGPIGVAAAQRGKGQGLALLIAGLHELRRLGADDVVIDWTDLIDFYGRVGFEPWLRYTLAAKDLT